MLKKSLLVKNTSKTSLLQQHKKTLLFFSLLGCLQACGDGGGSGSTPTPTIPRSYEFSLTSTLTNKCGEKLPFVDVELFIQNSDWSVVETLQPDANGVFTFTSDTELINYTIAAKTQPTGQEDGLEFVSFYQAKATTPAIYQAKHSILTNNENCECVTKNVSIEHATTNDINEVTTSATFVDATFTDSRNTVFNGVEVCHVTGGDWPLHSFSVIGTDNNNEVIGRAAFINEVFGNEVWEVSAFETSSTESLAPSHQAFTHEQRINANSHFVIDVQENDTSVQLFKAHDYVDLYRSEAEYVFEERPNLNEYLRTSSKQVITSEIYQDSLMVEAETAVPEAFTDDRSMNVIAIRSDGSYDFTSLADFPMAIVTINFQSINSAINSPIPVTWITYGPIEGIVPIKVTLPGYESLIDERTHFRIDSQVIQSGSSNTYDDYVSYFQNFVDLSFESNVNSYQIIID